MIKIKTKKEIKLQKIFLYSAYLKKDVEKLYFMGYYNALKWVLNNEL